MGRLRVSENVSTTIAYTYIDKEEKQLKLTEEERKEEERKLMIQDMIKRKLVIPMEEPVDVARKYRKKKRTKLPSLTNEKTKQEKQIEKEEEEIKKRGIYFIKGNF